MQHTPLELRGYRLLTLALLPIGIELPQGTRSCALRAIPSRPERCRAILGYGEVR